MRIAQLFVSNGEVLMYSDKNAVGKDALRKCLPPDCSNTGFTEWAEAFKETTCRPVSSSGQVPRKVAYPTQCPAYCKSSMSAEHSRLASNISAGLLHVMDKLGGYKVCIVPSSYTERFPETIPKDKQFEPDFFVFFQQAM